jgi:hypothetical protein
VTVPLGVSVPSPCERSLRADHASHVLLMFAGAIAMVRRGREIRPPRRTVMSW